MSDCIMLLDPQLSQRLPSILEHRRQEECVQVACVVGFMDCATCSMNQQIKLVSFRSSKDME